MCFYKKTFAKNASFSAKSATRTSKLCAIGISIFPPGNQFKSDIDKVKVKFSMKKRFKICKFPCNIDCTHLLRTAL